MSPGVRAVSPESSAGPRFGPGDLRRCGARFAPLPRVLHQIWMTTEERGRAPAIPPELRRYPETWRRHHPGWEYRLWRDADVEELLTTRYPWFRPAFEAFPRDIQRVDAAKYMILQTHGGVYADLDTECLRPVDPILACGGAIVSRTPDGAVSAAILASAPGHPFWDAVLADLQSPPISTRLVGAVPGCEAGYVLLSTGPGMLRRVVRRYQRRSGREPSAAGLTVCASRFFCSRMWLRRREGFAEPGAFVHHHYSDTWLLPWEARALRFVTLRSMAALLLGVLALAALAAFAR